MTAPDPRVGEIEARLARREAMIEDGSYKISRTRCNDPEREGFHHSHPQQVWTETLHHNSYISHLEALADHVAYLLAELRDREGKLARVEAECKYLDTLADGDKYYAKVIRAAVAAAGGGGDRG